MNIWRCNEGVRIENDLDLHDELMKFGGPGRELHPPSG